MATYYVMVVPRPGEDPDPTTCPLAPRDVSADSEEEAVRVAEAYILEDEHEISELYETSGGMNPAEEWAGYAKQWQVVAQRVDRPTVDLKPYAYVSDIVRDDHVIGQSYDYGEELGTASFEVLIAGIVSGRLTRRPQGGRRVWFIDDAQGPLASLADREWIDRSPGGLGATLRWLHAVLADIRASLEAN